MRNTFATVALAASALALAGCVVQPVDGRYVPPQQQQPVYQQQPTYQPVQPKRLIVEGPWQLRERGQFVRRIDVRLVRGGIEVASPQRTFFAQRVAPGVFQDDRGRTYEFISDTRGRFENPNNGRRMRLRRP